MSYFCRTGMVILLASAALALPACASTESQFDPAAVDANADAFVDWLKAHKRDNAFASLSVMVLRDGEAVVEAYLGHQDDEFEMPTTAQTAYYVASVTKPVAGTALYLADLEGVFDLDRPVVTSERWRARFCEWFPDSKIVFAGAQLDDLQIPDFSCDNLTFRHVLHMQGNGAPGTAFLYNPVAFANLSRGFEDLASVRFRAWLRERIFAPAGMTNTAAGWRDRDAAHVLTDLAMPFVVRDGRFAKQPLPDDDLRAAAGLYMTPRDLAKFDWALDNDRLMSPEQREAMWTPPRNGDGRPSVYAHGWYVQSWNEERLVWHGGWQPEAYSAIYLKVPARRLTLIALANTESLHWGNPLNDARVHESDLVAEFLQRFVVDSSK